MDIKGKLVEIYDVAQISDKFQKREFVIEYAENPQYPELIKFECIQDKCDLLNSFSIGQEVEVHFNLKGRKWTDRQGEVKYFNSLQAWRIQAAQQGNNPAAKGQDTAPLPTSEPEWLSSDNGDDDLPF